MRFLLLFFSLILVLSSSLSNAGYVKLRYGLQDGIAKTILVDQSGQGDFKSLQQAIDSVPLNNPVWTRIHVKTGIYTEKVRIPKDKERIVIEGENPGMTVIQFDDAGDAIQSSTFIVLAEYFIAVNITFKNTYNHRLPKKDNGEEISWAPAALVHTDKAAFYHCGFVSLQDTLTDSFGRHYFEQCYIEGAIDFIWGNGQSIYQKCELNVTASALGATTGYITAQGRDRPEDTSGYVFKSCGVVGTGSAYLGRAYGKYSRVVFDGAHMSQVVAPQGWDSWTFRGQEDSIYYVEAACTGPGSNRAERVKWEKNITLKELDFFKDTKTFIDQDGWMANLPITH